MDHEICDRLGLGRHGMRSIHHRTPNVCRASAIPDGVICGAQYKLMQRGASEEGSNAQSKGTTEATISTLLAIN